MQKRIRLMRTVKCHQLIKAYSHLSAPANLRNFKDVAMGHRWILLFLFCTGAGFCSAQDTIRVLHYTETTGFDHGTRAVSQAMFVRICDSLTANTPHVWLLTHSDSSEVFDDLIALQQYKVVIWSNTTGAAGLTFAQQQNYELYVNGGGSYLGVHAASDTYRHSTANGNNTGVWDFYAENMSGCSVQENPNHTAVNHNNTMTHTTVHAILNGIPNPWNKTEEYYYWENGFIDSSYTELLRVNSTGTNSYDSARMTAHYKQHAWGSRSFYTSLGHDVANYTSDAVFELLLKNALYWTANPVASFSEEHEEQIIAVYPNPVTGVLTMTGNGNEEVQFSVSNATGQIIYAGEFYGQKSIDLSALQPGMYVLSVNDGNKMYTRRLIKK